MIALLAAVALFGQDQSTAFEAEAEELSFFAYTIGVCEPHIDRDDVTHFLAEFVGVEPDWGNEALMVSANVAARGYVKGRRERDSVDLDQTQCQRATTSAHAAFIDKVRERDPDYGR